MPKPVWLAVGLVVAGGIVTIGALALRSGEPALPPQDTAAVSPVQTVTVAPVENPAPSASPPSSSEATTPEVPTPAPPAADTLSQLPVEDVEPRAVHPVPEEETLSVPHVTLQDRQGHPLARPRTPAPPPPSYVPSVGPGSQQASAAPPPSYRPSVPPGGAAAAPPPSYRPSVPPGGAAAAPPPSYRPSVPPGGVAASTPQVASLPTSLSGPANATGTVSLAIAGHSVRLYGVLPPASTDRCALGTGTPQVCGDLTEAMLAARLARSASITCQLPPGAAAADSARVCRDASGVDIAGYLVSEGLAVADHRAGSGYAGAESAARSSGKGLWRFR